MKVFKRNAVIIVVLLFVCVAVYLNYSYNKGQDLSVDNEVAATEDSTGDDSKKDGSDKEETANTDEIDSEDSKDSEDENSSDTSGLYYQSDGESASDYFASAKLSRQQSRDSATELLKEAASLDSASQEQIDSAVASISVMANYSVLEAKIENTLLAKDFSECMVFISDGTVNVSVTAPAEGLSDTSVAKITETVLSEIDVSTDQINIIEIN